MDNTVVIQGERGIRGINGNEKIKMDLSYEPAIPLLGIYPKKPKTLT